MLKLIIMIRFVYPNINASEQFVGCGRYATLSPGEPGLSGAYSIAEPNVGHLSKVTTAASLLARESFESECDVYEYKDRRDTPYLGDSMGLAYLLALIHRSRQTCWEKRGQSFFSGFLRSRATQRCRHHGNAPHSVADPAQTGA